MALLRNKDAMALFLAAIIVQALVFSPYPALGQANCGVLKGCNVTTCGQVCKAKGYVDFIANCKKVSSPGKKTDELCCCYEATM
ncbi:hypothetical protein EJB05_09316, partial [Eragrostis curvula]